MLQFSTYLSVISIIIQHNLTILLIPFLFVNDIINLDIWSQMFVSYYNAATNIKKYLYKNINTSCYYTNTVLYCYVCVICFIFRKNISQITLSINLKSTKAVNNLKGNGQWIDRMKFCITLKYSKCVHLLIKNEIFKLRPPLWKNFLANNVRTSTISSLLSTFTKKRNEQEKRPVHYYSTFVSSRIISLGRGNVKRATLCFFQESFSFSFANVSTRNNF